ncbi:hypothetical protein MYP_1886 [Sporocytophaga myxococcoides]|uniref:Uncharacterized protein n=1 Tax=Sporocytophaga myxococcoides TaxID=153721 RepID=A0A098LEE2_9BACT|nr:hypothetical protein [Sporocytophaga myxococcoides]GAL84658.1 hypothetical protein MYP_1886 [Sporocytophaga myxococcoides]
MMKKLLVCAVSLGFLSISYAQDCPEGMVKRADIEGVENSGGKFRQKGEADYLESDHAYSRAIDQVRTESDVDPYAETYAYVYGGDTTVVSSLNECVFEDSLKNKQYLQNESSQIVEPDYLKDEDAYSFKASEDDHVKWNGGKLEYESETHKDNKRVKYKDKNLRFKSEESGKDEKKVKYADDLEGYNYERKKDNSKFDYFYETETEAMEVKKKKDGEAKVYYDGEFDNLDEINNSELIEMKEAK